MLRLPAALERRLQELFPRARDREQFVTNLVEEALATTKSDDLPVQIGGTLHLFSDGGSRGNPGHAAIACIIEDPVSGTVLKEHFERIGQETNNVAEYRALIKGLELARAFQPNRLIAHLDSELVVKQVNGEYKVKMPTLQPLVDEVQELANDLPDVVFVHIPREDNYRADALVNRALDELPNPMEHPKPVHPPHIFERTPLPGDRYRDAQRRMLILVGFFGLLGLSPSVASAAAGDILYRHEHFLFTVPAYEVQDWTRAEDAWTYAGEVVMPPQSLLADGDVPPVPPAGFARTTRSGYSLDAIRETLRSRISERFDRPAGSVVIRSTGSGDVVFDGVGLPGRRVDLDALAALTIEALQRGLYDIEIPIEELPADVRVESAELQDMGIQEVVTVGESNYAGSPVNRRHNIATGLARFNGHIIPQGTVFSFGKELGPVDGTTGYRKELVIKGDRTEPDYGGGLCQVSTTAYRGAWEYGFPIEQRINHSYAVSYYGPQGTDATVYPPNPDMKFTNDSPGALLIQTHHDEDDHAYFIYYGTKDARRSSVYGPFIWARTAAPPDRTITTTELPPGQRRKVGDRHPGMTAAWVRQTTLADGTYVEEPVISIYQARPLFYEVGASAPTEEPSDINTPKPPRAF